MANPDLSGRTILIVDTEPLVALDMADEFHVAGAHVLTTAVLKVALEYTDMPALSAAVIDVALSPDQSAILCKRLKERAIPFFHYSGVQSDEAACLDASYDPKPAPRGTLVRAVADLLAAEDTA